MASLARLPELVGFFSYSREDDEAFRGSLSALRDAIQRELGAQLGRTKRNFRLWQDQEAIAPGKDWEAEITRAVEQSVFFIPIVTPRAVSSDYCKFEFSSFVARERALGRSDLVFPILYISVSTLMDEAEWRNDPVLSIVAKRQYVDWRPFRHDGVNSPVFGQAIERFCAKIVETLREPWLSPDERRQMEAEARKRADDEERVRQEAEAKRQAEERERLRKETLAKQRSEEEDARRRREEAEAQRRLVEEERRQEGETKKAAEQQQAVEKQRARGESEVPRPPAETEAKRSLRGPQNSNDISEGDRTHIVQNRGAAQRRKLRAQALAGALVVAMAVGVGVWWNQNRLNEEAAQEQALKTAQEQAAKERALKAVQEQAAQERALQAAKEQAAKERARLREEALPNVGPLTAAQERAPKAGDSFKECANCPEMVVVPAGHFMMGSPAGQGRDWERPQHEVTIAKPFAVAKFPLTFDEWDACAAQGGCRPDVSDNGWGRGQRPVINVNWDDVQAYIKWLAGVTGKDYRLLSEAEYEYAARAGTETKYPWGEEIKLNGKPMANCVGCGSQWDGRQTAPVGSFPTNAFGLSDMVGNVVEWTEDCWNEIYESYQGAPSDGSPWTSGSCNVRIVRGGSWIHSAGDLRFAVRRKASAGDRYAFPGYLGFRVARTLTP